MEFEIEWEQEKGMGKWQELSLILHQLYFLRGLMNFDFNQITMLPKKIYNIICSFFHQIYLQMYLKMKIIKLRSFIIGLIFFTIYRIFLWKCSFDFLRISIWDSVKSRSTMSREFRRILERSQFLTFHLLLQKRQFLHTNSFLPFLLLQSHSLWQPKKSKY